MSFRIVQLWEPEQKKKAAREILEALTDWFGVPESREEYIEKAVLCHFGVPTKATET